LADLKISKACWNIYRRISSGGVIAWHGRNELRDTTGLPFANLTRIDIPVRSNVELGQDDGNPISPLEDEHCRGQECPRSQPGGFEILLREVVTDADTSGWVVLEGADHAQIAERARRLKTDLLLGSSKGYPVARELGVPLVRVGFPIHDRIGGQRVLHLGYRGAQRLLDQIVNTLLERRQDDSGVGYSYL
jgi:hypothetical protein